MEKECPICTNCGSRSVSVGCGFSILCKDCTKYKYAAITKSLKRYFCENALCEGKLLPNSRYNSILLTKQPCYFIIPPNYMHLNPYCYYCTVMPTQNKHISTKEKEDRYEDLKIAQSCYKEVHSDKNNLPIHNNMTTYLNKDEYNKYRTDIKYNDTKPHINRPNDFLNGPSSVSLKNTTQISKSSLSTNKTAAKSMVIDIAISRPNSSTYVKKYEEVELKNENGYYVGDDDPYIKQTNQLAKDVRNFLAQETSKQLKTQLLHKMGFNTDKSNRDNVKPSESIVVNFS